MVVVCSHVVDGDKLIIEKVTCKRVATGIDNWAKVGAAALGSIVTAGAVAIAGGATVVGTGGVAIGTVPVTLGALVSASASGAATAQKALEFLDGATSGHDNLIINVNGVKVYPSWKSYYDIYAGQTIYPNVAINFNQGCRIQLIEYDWGSDNDNMGSILVNSDDWDNVYPGKNYKVNDAIAFSLEENSVYYVTYRVERDHNNYKPRWMLCGTAACKKCSERWCTSTSNAGLDRDGDKEDLRNCPYPMVTRSFKKYPQTWPFDDVYLRICSDPGAK